MMRIDIICVGKVKEKYIKQGLGEYLKRLTSYAKVNILEVGDEATQEKLSTQERAQILSSEASRIRNKLKGVQQLIVLAIEGELITSEDLARQLDDFATYGNSHVAFVIGGSLGLAEELKKEANWSISFGRITLPHQLIRLVLLEQIYRAFRISKGHAYHK